MRAPTEDLDLPVFEVIVERTDAHGGRYWAVTFADFPVAAYNDSSAVDNDIPLLISDGKNLGTPNGASAAAAGAHVYHVAGRDGAAPIYGQFALTWRGATTEPIEHDASADALAAALEAMPTIGAVRVERSGPYRDGHVWNGYVWTVTFDEVFKRAENVASFTGSSAAAAEADLEAHFWWARSAATNAAIEHDILDFADFDAFYGAYSDPDDKLHTKARRAHLRSRASSVFVCVCGCGSRPPLR